VSPSSLTFFETFRRRAPVRIVREASPHRRQGKVSTETHMRGASVVGWVVYVFCVVNLQAIFRLLTGQESQLAVVATTLLIAVLLNLFRLWLRNLIDRRLKERQARTIAREVHRPPHR
jgi:hypothetical protein